MSDFGYLRILTAARSATFYGWQWPTQLRHFTLYSRVCYLGRLHAQPIQFLRAAGAAGLVLSTTFYKKWAIVLMPSGLIKIFWNQIYAHSG
jgi:hypothetical protein